mgnify:CR=1 FL=1
MAQLTPDTQTEFERREAALAAREAELARQQAELQAQKAYGTTSIKYSTFC